MFHNVLMTSLTALRNTDEINSWQNQPFTTIWPEDRQSFKSIQPKCSEIRKTIKKKQKRNRTAYSTDQLRVLEVTYKSFKYVSPDRRKELADSLGISEKSIKVWFQNRRMKEKRESSESSSDSSTEMSSPPQPSSTIFPAKIEQEDTKAFYENFSPIKTEQEENKVFYPNVFNQFESNVSPNEPNQFDFAKTPQYEFPNFHFCNMEYQNGSTLVSPATEPLANDPNAYPTYYYPTLGNYYYGESHQFENNAYGNEAQWSATNFDLNYF